MTTPRRIGIFRRIAVVRYSGAMDPQQPELLRPWPVAAVVAAVVLACTGAVLLLA